MDAHQQRLRGGAPRRSASLRWLPRATRWRSRKSLSEEETESEHDSDERRRIPPANRPAMATDERRGRTTTCVRIDFDGIDQAHSRSAARARLAYRDLEPCRRRSAVLYSKLRDGPGANGGELVQLRFLLAKRSESTSLLGGRDFGFDVPSADGKPADLRRRSATGGSLDVGLQDRSRKRRQASGRTSSKFG